MTIRRILIITLASLAISFCAAPGHAADARRHDRNLYLRYCSACHGSEGKGDGVVSGLMTPRPTDLTQLAQKNGGQFPFFRTMRIIDGRETIRGHGDPDMPVWGELFALDASATTEQQTVVRGKLMLITEYLESIQVKSETR